MANERQDANGASVASMTAEAWARVCDHISLCNATGSTEAQDSAIYGKPESEHKEASA